MCLYFHAHMNIKVCLMDKLSCSLLDEPSANVNSSGAFCLFSSFLYGRFLNYKSRLHKIGS